MEIKKDNKMEEIIYKMIFGSKLYGTCIEEKEANIVGIFLPKVEDLLLCKSQKYYKNISNDIEETYYSLQYYLELLFKGDVNAIDILFSYTNEETVLKITPIWNNIIKNADNLLSKDMSSYLCYCKRQLLKYSMNGERLKNFKKFANFLSRENSHSWADNNDTTLYQCLNFALGGNYNNKVIDNHIPKGVGKIKFTEIDFGDDCYIETTSDKENYVVISGVKFKLQNWCEKIFDKVQEIIFSYGRVTKEAQNGNKEYYKSLSEVVRVILQLEEILKTGRLKFPLNGVEFIKSIKYKTTDMSFDEIIACIENKIKDIEELLSNSKLKDKIDKRFIDKIILDSYGYRDL
jgi:hypothetical protein